METANKLNELEYDIDYNDIIDEYTDYYNGSEVICGVCYF